MKDRGTDIEKLFRESFDSFEADVNPSAWDSISQQISSNPGVQDPSSASSASGTSAGAGAGSIGVAKIALIIASAGIISFGAYSVFSDDEGEAPVEEVMIEEVTVEENPVIQPEISTKTEESAIQEKQVSVNAEPAKTEVKDTPKETTVVKAQSNPVLTDNKTNAAAVKGEEKTSVPPKEQTGKTSGEKSGKDEQAAPVAKKDSPEERIKEMDIFEASIYASVKTGKTPLEVRFENRGSFASDVRWYFDNGDQEYASSVRHIFEESGEHWVILEIRDELDRKSKDSVMITVEGNTYINVPNVFTPNGDGMHDAFMVETENIGQLKCQIFDRSGNLIYSFDNKFSHWNGENQATGQPAIEGVYFYIVETWDVDGNKLDPKRGTVSLFR